MNTEFTISSFNFVDILPLLEEGSPLIFPTDTLPALGIIPKYSNKLWDIKKRPLSKPLILLGSDKEQLFEFILPAAKEDALKMAHEYWPGALTMVLPGIGIKKDLLNKNSNTIGMRVPNNYLARELLRESGPLATTSANLSGQEPVLTAEEAFSEFPKVPLLGPVPWPKPSGMASTVIEWDSPGEWKILRKGAIFSEDIEIK